MANRSNVTSNFEGVSPPWSLVTLDGYLNTLASTLNDSSLGLANTGVDTGTANNYVVPTLPYGSFSGYKQGSMFGLIPANINTGPSTLTIGLLGSVPILDVFGNPLLPGVLIPGTINLLVYIGTSFRMVQNRASVSWETIHTPTFNVWNVIPIWTVLAGAFTFVGGITSTALVSNDSTTNIFTLKANCLIQLNMENGTSGNIIGVSTSSISGGVLPAQTANSPVSPSSDFQLQPLMFFATVGSQFSVSDISFDSFPPPPGTNYTMIFSPA